jgi:hypothetical protein
MQLEQEIRSESAGRPRLPILLAIGALAIGTFSRAQEIPPAHEVDENGNLMAHACRPDCPCRRQLERTAADDHPDVGNRPRFRQAIGRQRMLGVGFDFIDLLPTVPELVLSRNALPDEMIGRAEDWIKIVLAPTKHPVTDDAVQWVGFKSYPRSTDLNHFVGRWTDDRSIILVDTTPEVSKLTFTLKVRGDDRLVIRHRPPVTATEDYFGWQYLDNGPVLRMLSTTFRFPFETVDDFVIEPGSSGDYDGVYVFSGRVHSKYRADEHFATVPADESKLRWYDDVILFITDSDPQYFCVTVDTRRGDAPR